MDELRRSEERRRAYDEIVGLERTLAAEGMVLDQVLPAHLGGRAAEALRGAPRRPAEDLEAHARRLGEPPQAAAVHRGDRGDARAHRPRGGALARGRGGEQALRACAGGGDRHRARSRRGCAAPGPRPRARAGRRSSSAGPGPSCAARSPGFASWQRSSDRQPQPMHSVRPALNRSSSAMRSSMRAVQPLDRRDQSRRVGRAVRRQLGELRADLVEREADALREDDERDPAQHRARVAAVARAGALGGDQPALLVEAQRGGGDAAARGATSPIVSSLALTSSSLELVLRGAT